MDFASCDYGRAQPGGGGGAAEGSRLGGWGGEGGYGDDNRGRTLKEWKTLQGNKTGLKEGVRCPVRWVRRVLTPPPTHPVPTGVPLIVACRYFSCSASSSSSCHPPPCTPQNAECNTAPLHMKRRWCQCHEPLPRPPTSPPPTNPPFSPQLQ